MSIARKCARCGSGALFSLALIAAVAAAGAQYAAVPGGCRADAGEGTIDARPCAAAPGAISAIDARPCAKACGAVSTIDASRDIGTILFVR